MSELKLVKSQMIARDDTPVRLVYDEEADILEIFFGANTQATGIGLMDQIVLHVDRKQRRAVSLMLLNFSVLSEQTEYGPRSFMLDALVNLPEELREIVLRVITTLPVSQFLKLSHLQTAPINRCRLLLSNHNQHLFMPNPPLARQYLG